MYRRFDWLLGIHLQACLLRIYLEKKIKIGWLHFNLIQLLPLPAWSCVLIQPANP